MPERIPLAYLRSYQRLALPWLLLICAGCNAVLSTPPVEYKSLLRSVETAPESVTLEIFHLRIPANEPKLEEDIWHAIDEQRLDLDLRRQLVSNGFRAGVLGSTLPDELARQLNLEDEATKLTAERVINGKNADPQIKRRVLQLNRHEPAVIQASDVQAESVVMFSGQQGVRGKRYEEVQAVYSLRAEQVPGQRVLLRITPELRHGEMLNRYSGSVDQGILLMMPSREREAFDDLKLTTELAPGELLVVSCQSESSGSLGHTFHGVDQNGPAEQKLVLIRLLQVPTSEILADANY